MRLIILAAGQSSSLDGIVKALLINPNSNRSFLDHTCSIFSNYEITVVVGYKAIEIMQAFPKLDYVYNSDWAITQNAYSLALALDERPCVVVSADMLFSNKIEEEIANAPQNSVLVKTKENRDLTDINCIVNNNKLVETYMGPLRSSNDPALTGIFKINSPVILKKWKENCFKHGNLFAGQALPLDASLPHIKIAPINTESTIYEINTVLDYINLLNLVKKKNYE